MCVVAEGVLMYSLDDALVFDPTDLGAEVRLSFRLPMSSLTQADWCPNN